VLRTNVNGVGFRCCQNPGSAAAVEQVYCGGRMSGLGGRTEIKQVARPQPFDNLSDDWRTGTRVGKVRTAGTKSRRVAATPIC
jgi:hypothetical protein